MATTIQTSTITRALDAGAIKVLRNTYALLAMTLLFSVLTAAVSMAMRVGHMGLWTLLPYFVLLFLVEKNKNSTMGLVWVFALTGWLGFSLGPILNHYVGISGFEPVLVALGVWQQYSIYRLISLGVRPGRAESLEQCACHSSSR